jgi:DMSO/TMAO reductase YedYZ molybdopterin-dependent catalytic subunit
MTRAILDPASPYMRHPLRPHQLHDRVTKTDDTIVLCHFGVPQLSAGDWSLSIDGLVRRPLHLSLAALTRRSRTEIATVHECCGSPLKPDIPTRRVCNVIWGGVKLSDLIEECEPEPAARFLWSRGADYGTFNGLACDAYVKDLPLDRATADVLIAYEMNGEKLRPENGYPARLVVPGFYGTNSVKWLTGMTLADRRADSPFTTRWYNDVVRDEAGEPSGDARPVWAIAPESVIVSPAPDEGLSIGQNVEIWGWAWSDRPVSTVEIGVSDAAGPETEWAQATVEPQAGRSWRRFAMTWRPTRKGAHVLRSRATSIDGASQPPAGARNAVHDVPTTVT